MGLFSSRGDLEVDLVSFGSVPANRRRTVTDALETHFTATVTDGGRLLPEAEIETTDDGESPTTARDLAYHDGREQYDVGVLVTTWPEDADPPVFWITEEDVYFDSTSRNYVFGAASIGDEVAAVSTARLSDGESWSTAGRERLRKQAIKQFARSLGGERCDDSDCVLYPAAVPRDLDRTEEYVCPDCAGDVGESNLR